MREVPAPGAPSTADRQGVARPGNATSARHGALTAQHEANGEVICPRDIERPCRGSVRGQSRACVRVEERLPAKIQSPAR